MLDECAGLDHCFLCSCVVPVEEIWIKWMADPAATHKKYKTINSIKTLWEVCSVYACFHWLLPVMNWHLVQGALFLCWEVSWALDACNPDKDYLFQNIDGWILYEIPKMGFDLIENWRIMILNSDNNIAFCCKKCNHIFLFWYWAVNMRSCPHRCHYLILRGLPLPCKYNMDLQ